MYIGNSLTLLKKNKIQKTLKDINYPQCKIFYEKDVNTFETMWKGENERIKPSNVIH